jgi:hypothetical protein
MDLKVGDKVKFLNASGGGIISRIIDSRMVGVMVEEGFEIPTMAGELIRIGGKETGARFFDAHYKIDPIAPVDESTAPADDRLRELPPSVKRDRKSEDIWLAFVPHDQKWLITGMVDVMLVNNTGCDVLYNIFSRTPLGHYEGMDYGSIFPDSVLLVDTINREQLSHWTEGNLQFLFHRQQAPAVLPPFNSEFKVDGKKFFKEGNYRNHPMIDGKGIVVKVISLTEYFADHRPGETTIKQEQPAQAALYSPGGLISVHQVAPREAEVDLHIHELVEDPANLEKGEILEFQKNYARRCLESAVSSGYLKVTFIHGVGNGTLKNSLNEILKNYSGIVFFEAPMAKYGMGAIEVRIPHNLDA